MPVKFEVQRKVRSVVWNGMKMKMADLWQDTEWSDISLARQQWPDETYREVMTQW